MLRVRFRSSAKDARPVNWPIKHPYWISGYGDDHAILIAYADDKPYILDNWPEATHLEIEEVYDYEFTSRFPRPSWFTEPRQ